MLSKVLVANRGEIAIRAFRAASELGIRTVAVYTHEDRGALHRLKADEAYQIGEPGHPVRAYLDIDSLVDVATKVGADAIYPGYGFLSESFSFATRVQEAGLTFVGPPPRVLELTGDKTRARDAAQGAEIPVLSATDPVADPDDAVAKAENLGFPVFVKAAAGGGGRGLRRVDDPKALADAVATAMHEADAAFGDPTVFLEEAVVRPRHIEVQLLGADDGIIHLFERDCSLQRRHQKVLEIAPAPNLSEDLRERICADAVRFGRAVEYRNAGTAEFLLSEDGRHVFIEMNPRIQVEHTVTEETTDVDLVSTQLRIAGGETLGDLGLSQESIQPRGAAIQCRVTTEDPANGFRPDTGRISAYRSAGGAGIRLDAGSAFTGSEVSPYFDSLLVKLTARGSDLSTAAMRARRALAEFRVRGVSTNVAFLRAVLADDDFANGNVTTAFLDERPDLTGVQAGKDRASRLLDYLANVTVNQPNGAAPVSVDPASKLPHTDLSTPVLSGPRDRLAEVGPAAFAAELRAQTPVGLTDTTMRDAHQSLLATRVRTFDLLAVAPTVTRTLPQLWSHEVWGGATYDVALRFLHEDPWDRLAALREAMPSGCLQMLLRGANALGYTGYPAAMVNAFVKEAHATGIDIFRIFDALNNVDQMRPAVEAVLEHGGYAQGTLCYTSDLHDPNERVYTLDHYLSVAEELIGIGVHGLCIKDMAGLLRAPAAATLVTALRERFDVPVHLHTHDTGGGQLATYLAALQAGVDTVDGASAPMSGMTSQPSLAAIVAATDHGERASGISLDALGDLEPYWEAVRRLYAPFESGLGSPTGTVYRHEIPGGQLSNLRQQAVALGLGGRWEEIEASYARCDDLLGGLIKVTPSSKVVGDLALYLVSSGVDIDDFAESPGHYDVPDSVLGFLRGELGTPPGGWPEPFRSKALKGREGTFEPPELTSEQRAVLAGGDPSARRALLDELQFPGPAKDYREHTQRYGNLSVIPTRPFLYGLEAGQELTVDLEQGVRLFFELEAISDPDERGLRTVMCNVNGQVRPVDTRDVDVQPDVDPVEKADAGNPAHIAATLTGVVTVSVGVGDQVEAGQAIGTLEAMKMEQSISAPVGGTVRRVAVASGTNVEPGDLLVELEPEGVTATQGRP